MASPPFQSIPENNLVPFLVSYVNFGIFTLFAESEDARIVREFAELLDASEAYHNTVRSHLFRALYRNMFSSQVKNDSCILFSSEWGRYC